MVDILLAVVDGLKGFPEAIAAVFPRRSFRRASSTCCVTRWTGRRIRTYRRAVGWIIVALSFGMAIYAIADAIGFAFEMDDLAFTAIGAGAALLVIAILLRIRRLRRLGLEDAR